MAVKPFARVAEHVLSNRETTPDPIAPKQAVPHTPGKVVPCSEDGKRICLNLNPPFTPMDVNVRLDGPNTGKGSYFIAEWVKQGWVERAGFSSYKHTAKIKS